MAQRKTVEEQIALALEEERQLKNRLNLLLQKKKDSDDKARTHRLCKRAGYLESILPETIPLTDEQFYQFLDKTLTTKFAREILIKYYPQDMPENAESGTAREN